MNKIKLLIARHGETDYNKGGLLQGRGINAPLNETGKLQAQSLAGYINQYPISYVGSSSMLRAQETAQFYASANGMDILHHAGLDEMNFGEFEGKSYLDIVDELDPISQAWKKGEIDLKIPGGESPKEVFERANDAFEKIFSSMNRGYVFVVAHGRLLRILLSEWLGYGLRNMDKINHYNCGVNQIVYSGGAYKAEYLNKTDYLNK